MGEEYTKVFFVATEYYVGDIVLCDQEPPYHDDSTIS